MPERWADRAPVRVCDAGGGVQSDRQVVWWGDCATCDERHPQKQHTCWELWACMFCGVSGSHEGNLEMAHQRECAMRAAESNSTGRWCSGVTMQHAMSDIHKGSVHAGSCGPGSASFREILIGSRHDCLCFFFLTRPLANSNHAGARSTPKQCFGHLGEPGWI